MVTDASPICCHFGRVSAVRLASYSVMLMLSGMVAGGGEGKADGEKA